MSEYPEDPLKSTTREKLSKIEKEKRKELVESGGRPSYGDSSSGGQIIESFNWLTSDYKTLKSKSKKTILLKVVAARANDVSLNQRKYVREELMKAARTFTGKPVTINHNPDKKIGNILSADFEDDSLEFLTEIGVEPYVTYLRHKKPFFSGVSIEANYRYNVCPICHERFETDEDFYDHQERVHLIQHDGVREPHGMLGTGLSLVTRDEQPGIPTAGFEVVETAQGLNRLYEMIMKEKGFKLTPKLRKRNNKQLVQEFGLTMQQLGEPFADYKDFDACVEANQDKEDPEAYCASIQKKAEEQEPCPEGEHRNEEGECVPDQVEELTKRIKELEKELTNSDVNSWIPTANKTLKHYGECIDDLQTQIDVLKKEPKSLTETVELKEKLDKAIIRIDNLEGKQKGDFKGVAKPVKETVEEYAEDPLKTVTPKRKR